MQQSDIQKLFLYYKEIGEKAIHQVPEDQLFWQPDEESNSIAILVKHLWGNMLSRWTDFLTTDGEKSWRNRDAEFHNDLQTKENILEKWTAGWNCLFQALEGLTEADENTLVYIRNQGHTVREAINRQQAHYAYHVGQIVFLAKMIVGKEWKSLSIPKGQSSAYNARHFSTSKRKNHFTDEFLTNDEITS